MSEGTPVETITRSLKVQLVVVALIGLALGAAIAAWQSSTSQAAGPGGAQVFQQFQANPEAQAFAGSGAGAAGPGAAGGQARRQGLAGQPPVVGTIDQVEPTRIVVRDGEETTTATVNDQTIVRKVESITRGDLAVGAAVIVTGERGDDGTVAAATVQVLPASTPAPGARTIIGGAAGGRTGAGGGASVMGTIEQLADTGFTLKSGETTTTVTLSDDTALRRVVEATVSDLAVGDRVSLVAAPGSNGELVARVIQVGEVDAAPEPGS